MSLINIEKLNLVYNSKTINEVHALSEINLEINEKDFVVILGASGCGKTSLLNILAGFLTPSSGTLKINNHPITGPGPDRCVIFQKNALMPWLNVKDNIALGLKFQSVPLHIQEERISKVLKWVGLEEFESNYIYQLSGGMQQRVGIARALASEPEILLMDEPLGAVDAITRQDIQGVIIDVWKETQKTILMVTHSIEEALFMATKLIIMTPRPGRIDKRYDLDFSKRYLAGEEAKSIKLSPEFLKLKNEVIELIEESSK